MQAPAVEFPGWRRKIPLLFGEKSLKTVCFQLCILKRALKWMRSIAQRLFKSFLARNARAASPQRVFFAG